MTYLAAALFFTLALLAALVAIHMTVRLNWREILLALRGGPAAARPRETPAGALRRAAS
ncbi:MAG TPA: hypothetical protein VFZ91_03885 [Allosphingosinicella sp.]